MRSNVGEPEGRIYVIVLDDTHVNFTRSARVRPAVRQFIERNLGANDLAAVVHTSGRQEASQDFTNNRRLLLGGRGQVHGQAAAVAHAGETGRVSTARARHARPRDPIRIPPPSNARTTRAPS